MSVNIKLIKGDEALDVAVEEGLRIMDLKHEKQCEEFLEDYECACEGSLACSTCHVILDEESYDKLEPAEDDENDMLDLAYGLTKTSRLGCQIKLTKNLDGMEIKIPSKNRNTAPGSKSAPIDPVEAQHLEVLFQSEEEDEAEKKLGEQYDVESDLQEDIDDGARNG